MEVDSGAERSLGIDCEMIMEGVTERGKSANTYCTGVRGWQRCYRVVPLPKNYTYQDLGKELLCEECKREGEGGVGGVGGAVGRAGVGDRDCACGDGNEGTTGVAEVLLGE